VHQNIIDIKVMDIVTMYALLDCIIIFWDMYVPPVILIVKHAMGALNQIAYHAQLH
jgi:hypothetical protein